MIIYRQAYSHSDLKNILRLQHANLPQNLSSEDLVQEGFVSVHHDFELLQKMNDKCAHTLAMEGEILAGYALSMHPDFKNEIPMLIPMFTEIEKHLSSKDSYIVMGQICIDKAFRKQGIFRNLYKAMQQHTTPLYSKIVTEVDHANQRSLKAHLAIGFRQLATYKADGKVWELIYLPSETENTSRLACYLKLLKKNPGLFSEPGIV
jgi:ribosomal protein S18 acetylase RimI-like enzyme